jgi:RNA polymerase sigma factor (sigma-70 family)
LGGVEGGGADFWILDSTDLSAFCERTSDEGLSLCAPVDHGDAAPTADLTQETCASLLRHVDENPDAPVGLPWLITCFRHRYLDSIRRRRRRERNEIRSWHPMVPEPADRDMDVFAALGRLRPDERAALVLRHVDGFSVGEIADTIGKSVAATVPSRKLVRSCECPCVAFVASGDAVSVTLASVTVGCDIRRV